MPTTMYCEELGKQRRVKTSHRCQLIINYRISVKLLVQNIVTDTLSRRNPLAEDEEQSIDGLPTDPD